MFKQLTAQLKRHEGYRRHPYRCTAGKLTIGFGRNLEDKGISEGEAETLLAGDIAEVRKELFRALPWLNGLPEVRQAVLINMAFNLGVLGLLQFRRMLKAVNQKDYDKAADEMLDSRWAEQVGNRATELAEQMRTGEWQGVEHE